MGQRMRARRTPDQGRQRARLPVVTVYDVIAGAGQRRPADGGVSQERKPLGVVGVVVATVAVEPLAIEVPRLLHEHRPHAGARCGVYARIHVALAEPHGDAATLSPPSRPVTRVTTSTS
jgi:hypothetical protein